MNYNSSLSNNKFLLIKGDISGIQEFIFNVKSENAARSLKGRSFFIKILTEIAIRSIFDLFNIDKNIEEKYRISTSGGNFFLKLPMCIDYVKIINNLQSDFSKALIFSGIDLIIEVIELDENKYSDCIKQLSSKIRKRKLNIFPILNNEDFDLVFNSQEKDHFSEIDDNSKWINITDCLKRNKFISIKIGGNFNLTLKDDSIELINYTCYFHNEEEINQKILLKDYTESLFPVDKNNSTLQFKDLAEFGEGDNKLGILKMDVDNLGSTLEKIDTIENHIKFDSELRRFFNYSLSNILNNARFFNKIYTVCAGGDDSFFVGNWKIILELAQKINTDFNNYPFFKKSNLTISAGYIITNSKFPVIRFSKLAEDALYKAKHKYKKGNICIFDEVIKWNRLNEIFNLKDNLKNNITPQSKGLLSKSRLSAIKGIDENQISLKDFWEIAYYMRHLKNQKQEIIKKINKNINDSCLLNISEQERRTLRLILPIASRLCELELKNLN